MPLVKSNPSGVQGTKKIREFINSKNDLFFWCKNGHNWPSLGNQVPGITYYDASFTTYYYITSWNKLDISTVVSS